MITTFYRHLSITIISTTMLIGCANKQVDISALPESTSHAGNFVPENVLAKIGVDRLPIPGSQTPTKYNNNTDNKRLISAIAGFETRETRNGLIVYLPPSARFASNSSSIKSLTRSKLQQLVNEINKPYLASRNIAISGHTDSVGNASSNMALSERRANAVKNEMITLGTDAARLSAAGFGESSPRYLAPSRQNLNRRVEFLIKN